MKLMLRVQGTEGSYSLVIKQLLLQVKGSNKKDYAHANTRLGRSGTSDLMKDMHVTSTDHSTCMLPCICVLRCSTMRM